MSPKVGHTLGSWGGGRHSSHLITLGECYWRQVKLRIVFYLDSLELSFAYTGCVLGPEVGHCAMTVRALGRGCLGGILNCGQVETCYCLK